MTPVFMGFMDTLYVQGGGSYTLKTVAPSTTRYDTITEGRAAVSMLMTSATGSTFAAVSILDPDKTYIADNSLASTVDTLSIEQRNNGWIKVYPSGFQKDSYITKGEVWKMGAQWRFGETVDASPYV